MSYGGVRPRHSDRVSPEPHYDQVPAGSLLRVSDGDLRPLRDPLLSRSTDPLPPPPPLPDQPPVGPERNSDLEEDPALDIKPVRRFIPDSVKKFFRASGRSDQGWAMPGSNNNNNSSSEGVRCSPPHSPSAPGSYRDPYGGSGRSCHSGKELLEVANGSQSGRTYRTGLSYGEQLEEYHQRYAFMKSWPGLLRILGCVELLLGAAIFACVCAYLHKDQEWHNMYGYSSPGGAFGAGYGAAYGGSYYTGPKTAFVLVIAGLAWLVTVILLVLGMTMYYRTILLDSTWWPLTEFTINLVLAVLFMAAGIVYVRDTTRGGLCYLPVFNTAINVLHCRTEAGQTAAIIFLFANMVVYLISAGVCLKLWRHEASRRRQERYGQEMQPTSDLAAARSQAGPALRAPQQVQGSSVVPIQSRPEPGPPQVLQGGIPSGHIPKPVIVPDYMAKYPSIRTDEERDQYRAVFNDQYAEYKELHADVQATGRKFQEMDAMMRTLPQPASRTEVERIHRILEEFQKKKNDPAFLEKKERCEYLKSKLSHIKQKIQEYDKVMEWSDGYD